MTFKTFLVSFVLFTTAASAQPVIGGLILGSPLTDAIQLNSVPGYAAASVNNGEFIVGPFVQVNLPFRFALEVDALHRGYSFDLTPGSSSTSISSWEFPVLAKYRFWKGPVRPFAEGGLVFNHVSGFDEVITAPHDSTWGVSLGAGVDIHALVLHISPEIRYDGFVFKNFGDQIQSIRNQAMFVVAIGF